MPDMFAGLELQDVYLGGGSTDKGLKEGDVGFLVGGEGAEEGRGIHVEWF
jgi:hypothetical protein